MAPSSELFPQPFGARSIATSLRFNVRFSPPSLGEVKILRPERSTWRPTISKLGSG